MKTLLTATLALVFSFSSEAIVLEKSVVKGKVVSFNENEVVVVDVNKVKHIIPRKNIPKNIKLGSTDQIQASQGMYTNIPPKQKTTFLDPIKSLLNLIIGEAHCDAEEFNCFWGGWPTNSSGGDCRAPYSRRNTAVSDDSPFKYHSCGGGSDVYRCNPVIFGPAAGNAVHSGDSLGAATAATGDDSVRVRPIPEGDAAKGICVSVRRPKDIVKNCVKASAHNFQSHLASIQANPANFEKFAKGVEKYCRDGKHRGNSACAHLRERLGAIQIGTKSKRTVSSCEYTSHGSFGDSLGETSTGANSCPGSLCYVQANCRTGNLGAGASRVPVTGVCGCNVIGGTDGPPAASANPTAAQITACFGDQGIAALQRNTTEGARQNTQGGAVIQQ